MRFVKLAALAAVVSLASGAAQAAVTLTFTGTVKSGSDGAGLFGSAGSSLAGQAFTSTYVIDDSNLSHYDFNAWYYAEAGTTYGTVSPIISASLDINGVSVDVGGSFYGLYQGQNAIGFYNGLYYQSLRAVSIGGPINNYVGNTCVDDKDPTPGLPHTCKSNPDGNFVLGDGASFGTLIATGATTTSTVPFGVSYVPEPTTWAMMIIGFGMIGAMTRGRRRLAA